MEVSCQFTKGLINQPKIFSASYSQQNAIATLVGHIYHVNNKLLDHADDNSGDHHYLVSSLFTANGSLRSSVCKKVQSQFLDVCNLIIVDRLFVDPEARGHKLGLQLIENAIKELNILEEATIVALCACPLEDMEDTNPKPLMAYYQRCGFTRLSSKLPFMLALASQIDFSG